MSTPTTGHRHAWIDASAGIAGDMLLGALLDAGARLQAVQEAVTAVTGPGVRIDVTEVTRAGLRALRAEVMIEVPEPGMRPWTQLRDVLVQAELPDAVRQRSLDVFGTLAGAEARVHGIPAGAVAFHEAGALDSIADVVGSCAALVDLGIDTLSVSQIAVGSGAVATEHGELAIPTPAVAELARGWEVVSGGSGELATPTGVAVMVALARGSEPMPHLALQACGVGAGTRDRPGRANVTRAFIGELCRPAQDAGDQVILLEANVDDLDPRVWPSVLAALMSAGADDAWLVPIQMKKGRPAHSLCVLCQPGRQDDLIEVIFGNTTTSGLRSSPRHKVALARTWIPLAVDGVRVRIKVAHRGGLIVQAMPEFEDVAHAATATGLPVRQVLIDASLEAARAGLIPGRPAPPC